MKKKKPKAKPRQKPRTRLKARKASPRGKPQKVKRGVQKERLAYYVDTNFTFYKELHALLAKTSPETFPFIERQVKKLGRVKLVIVTGVFLNIKNTRVDMLVVGEGIDVPKLTDLIKELEAEMGKEIRYVILSQEEFGYRYEMFDRFLGDILNYPHQKIINKLKI